MVWNLMGGEINWQALFVLVEMLGIEDPETLIYQLIQIRDRQNEPES